MPKDNTERWVKRLTALEDGASAPQSDLERVRNIQRGTPFSIRVTVQKFTSNCPFSGNPISAHLVIDYIPDGWLIETKALQRHLDGYKYRDAFHEVATVEIGRNLADFAEPRWLRICGLWSPVGGVPVEVYFQTGDPPKGVLIQKPGFADLREWT